jgi:hypothetical protein
MCLVPRPGDRWPSLIPAATPFPSKALKGDAPATLLDILRRHAGRNVGINLEGPAKIKRAFLVQVGADYFTVYLGKKGLLVHVPSIAIGSVVEAEDGAVEQDGRPYTLIVSLDPTRFPASGPTWFVGVSVPLD